MKSSEAAVGYEYARSDGIGDRPEEHAANYAPRKLILLASEKLIESNAKNGTRKRVSRVGGMRITTILMRTLEYVISNRGKYLLNLGILIFYYFSGLKFREFVDLFYYLEMLLLYNVAVLRYFYFEISLFSNTLTFEFLYFSLLSLLNLSSFQYSYH